MRQTRPVLSAARRLDAQALPEVLEVLYIPQPRHVDVREVPWKHGQRYDSHVLVVQCLAAGPVELPHIVLPCFDALDHVAKRVRLRGVHHQAVQPLPLLGKLRIDLDGELPLNLKAIERFDVVQFGN